MKVDLTPVEVRVVKEALRYTSHKAFTNGDCYRAKVIIEKIEHEQTVLVQGDCVLEECPRHRG